MYYEEMTNNEGVLFYRTTPAGKWIVKISEAEKAINALNLLSDEQRKDVFSRFCVHCGEHQPVDAWCQCWNDE